MNFLIDAIKKYKTILIDIDNTIFYSQETNKIAEKETLKYFNFSYSDFLKAKEQVKSRGLKSSQHNRKLYFKALIDLKNKKYTLLQEMYDFFIQSVLENDKTSNIIIDTLKYAKDNNKTVCAISDYYLTEQIKRLKNSHIDNYIDYIITSSEFEQEKPSKSLIDKALELTNSKAEDCIMIGDSENDNFSKYNIFSYPFSLYKNIISISGKSGSGKSTLSKKIKDHFNAVIIGCDGYHKYDRYSDKWKYLTHYNPDANNLFQLALDIQKIFYGKTTIIPVYNHSSGLFDKTTIKNDTNFLIFDGLHCLYKEIVDNFVKIKIYINNDNADARKIIRDVEFRNKNKDDVLSEIQKREEDYKKYIDIQRNYANIIIDVNKQLICTVQFVNELSYIDDFVCCENDLPNILIEYIEDILDCK